MHDDDDDERFKFFVVVTSKMYGCYVYQQAQLIFVQ